MPVHLKNVLFVLLGAAAPLALIACVASPEACRAQTPAEKKAREAQNRMLENQKKAIENQNKALAKMVREAQKKREAAALMAAYILLGSANGDYAGHREKAARQVRAALTLVDLIGLKQSEPRIKALQDLNKLASARLPAHGKGEAFESQILSDAQLAHAGGILQGLAFALKAENAPGPLGHVDNALREINAALRDSAENAMKGREAEVLTYAYILLASANHDYDGRRVKAMNQLKEACKILEANILRNGSVEERIKAIRDANVQGVANGNANATPALHEFQYFSDAQLLMAHALIQRVGSYMFANKTQPRVRHHLENADREIGIALMIR